MKVKGYWELPDSGKTYSSQDIVSMSFKSDYWENYFNKSYTRKGKINKILNDIKR